MQLSASDLARWPRALDVSAIVGALLAASCSPGDEPESIPLLTSPNTTTTTSTTTTTTTTTDGVAWTHTVSAAKLETGYNLTLVRRADRSLRQQGLASGRLHRRPDRGHPELDTSKHHRSPKCYRWCLTPSVTQSEFEDLQATVGYSCGNLCGARLGRADEQVSTVGPADGARERKL